MTVATHTTLELVGGMVVVAKRRAPATAQLSCPAAEGASIEAWRQTEAEARWLAAARHRGVAELLMVSAQRCRLETRHRGLATLRTLPLGPQATAGALAAVATTLAELHRRDLIHGKLILDHIVLPRRSGARPVLCSPSGTASDPAADIEGLASVAAAAAATWPRSHPAWTEVVEQLRSERHRLSAQRAGALLARLGRRRVLAKPGR